MMGQAPVANFTASITSGCAPLIVNFTDQSTGSPKFWNWDFGNGQLSSAQNPGGISFAPGTYTVTLVVRNTDGINSVTKTNFIVSSPSPTASFTSDKTISCLPGDIQFFDSSVPNSGTITEWYWDFGDGTTSTLANPKHSYANAGYYDVYIAVKNSTGCPGAASRSRFIRMVNGVKADFSYTGPSTCSPPYNIAYKNLTSGPGVLNYTWDLGNATTSTALSPSATYATGGNYTVKLKAQSDFGCADSIQKSIPINGVTTSFKSADSVCLGTAFVFQNTSSATPSKVLWNFGDGTTSTQVNPPPKTYAGPGNYTVTFSATFGNCSDIATKTVKVFSKPAIAIYSANSNSFCKPPAAVVIQNNSPDVVTAQWDFGDGGTSNSIAPTVTHTYTATGNFTVKLTITDSKGCTNTLTQTNFVNVLAPFLSIAGSPAGVCVGQAYMPVPSIGTVDGVASYAWNFGDGSPVDNAAAPSHAYATTGIKTVQLTMTTNGGCTAVASTTVTVGTPPVVDFDKDKTIVCRSELVTFTNLSVPPGTVVWDFGDGTSSTLQNPPPHKFPDTGFYNIKLKVTSNGCTDSLTKPNFVQVLPPVANFGYTIPNCTNKTTVAFKDSSQTSIAYPPIVYLWNFGDTPGTTSAVAGDVTFTYPGAASNITYNVKLVIDNGVCRDSITKTIQLINEKADFVFNAAPAVFCRKNRVRFTSTNTPAFIIQYEWVIDGAAPETGQNEYNTSFSTSGNHTVRLIITDINGCKDTSAPKSFTITGPTASFVAANNGGCKNGQVQFTDSSIPAVGVINKWSYDFGDGSPLSTQQNPQHAYADTGTYTVKFTVYDDLGCDDIDSATVTITKPTPFFSVAQPVFCPGTPLQFTDSSTGGGLTYAWFFGDGSTDNVQNPVHSYPGIDSVYSVKLVVTDSVGCKDSLTRTNYIKITGPKALYAVKDTATLCPPLETKFTFKGTDYESFLWDFGDGGSSSLPNPNHFYNSYGQYTAKLYVTGYGGCIDSAAINIDITDPYQTTSVLFDPKTNCNDLTVNFTIIAPSSARFTVYFGDGTRDTSQQTSFQHFYGLPNKYEPYIFLEDSVGCKILIGGQGSVDIKGAVPLFGMDKKKFCDSGTVFFTDYSQGGNDPVASYSWDFGDGVSGVTTKDAIHSYTQPGLYLPSLTVISQTGCAKTLTDTLRILATPQPVINSNDGVCITSFLNFTGSLVVPPDTAIIWKWGLGNGQTSDKQTVLVNYPDPGVHQITLEATNSLGCKGDTSKTITSYPLPVITLSGDTTLISGGPGITIPLTYSSNAVAYNWTPPTNLSCTDCPNPFASPKFTTIYNVRVTDSNGCVSNRNIRLVAVCTNNNFFLPNTFSPNGDGVNDKFYPRGTGLERIQALRIFNRWGELLFEKRNFPANDALSGWDGNHKGKLAAADTYIYLVDIICANANIITTKGNITLIR